MRRESLMGFINFRDLGGIYNKQGKRVRSGQIYRSEIIRKIYDLEEFRSLNLKHIFDYRTEKESLKEESIKIDGINYIRISAIENEENEILDMEPYFYKFMDGERKIPPVELLRETYKEMPFNNKAFKETIKKFKEKEVPFLNHCTSGKDRTGVITAIIYLILGISEEEIMKDYLKSNENRKEEIEKSVKFYDKELRNDYFKDQFRRMLGVEREFLETTFKEIKKRYNTYNEYFLQEFGLTTKDIEKIREYYMI